MTVTTPNLVDDVMLDTAVSLLSAHPDYRVLRRFTPRESYRALPDDPEFPPLKTALYLDTETTGKDRDRAKILELAMVPVTFDAYGRFYDVGAPAVWLNDPGEPISAEVQRITGLTDDDVRGQSIDVAAVTQLLAGADLVIAHHADYDRRICERHVEAFAGKAWACSYRDVDWTSLATTSAKLVHLLAETCGEFYDAHRATIDCLVGIHVLATAQLGDRAASEHLIESARRPTTRLWATGAPYGFKDTLKARGYQWHDGASGHAKAWYLDVRNTPESEAVEAEKVWLCLQGITPGVSRFTARDRYSVRVDR